MDRIPLNALERNILGKKVKSLRKQGLIPAHIFGAKLDSEHVSVKLSDFIPVLRQAGETGLIDLKVGADKVKPVMIRGVQEHPVKGDILHVDFYQVNLSEKVKVPVPIEITGGGEIEAVKTGEALVLQNIAEVEVEALPADLIEKIEVSVAQLKQIDDAITVSQLSYDRDKITVLADPEQIVVKLAPAVTEEMKKLMEEQAAEAAAAAQAEATEEGAQAPVEGEEAVEGEAASAESSGPASPSSAEASGSTEESKGEQAPEQPAEEKKE